MFVFSGFCGSVVYGWDPAGVNLGAVRASDIGNETIPAVIKEGQFFLSVPAVIEGTKAAVVRRSAELSAVSGGLKEDTIQIQNESGAQEETYKISIMFYESRAIHITSFTRFIFNE